MTKVYLGKYNAICALGSSIPEIFDRMKANQSGIKNHQFSFGDGYTFPVGKFENSSLLGLEETSSLYNNLCLRSIQQILVEEKISLNNPHHLLILATTKGSINSLTKDKAEANLSHSISFLQKELNCFHTPLLISNACISGVSALIYAHDFIKTKRYEKVVVCGADLLSDFVVSGFNTFQALSDQACTPYDENRSGVSLGEAVATAIVSNEESEIEILGGASSNDANHISGPSRDGSGLALAISKAMKQTGLNTFDFINAHGTATTFNDEMECKAYHSLGFQDIPLNSLKGFFGHTLGAAGLLESIICAEMMKSNLALTSLGFKSLGVSQALAILTENKSFPLNKVLKTASGFGGCNAAIVFKKNEGWNYI